MLPLQKVMLGLSPNRLPQNPVLFHHAPHYLSHFAIYLSMHNFESYTYRYLHTVQIYGIRVYIYYIMLYYIIPVVPHKAVAEVSE